MKKKSVDILKKFVQSKKVIGEGTQSNLRMIAEANPQKRNLASLSERKPKLGEDQEASSIIKMRRINNNPTKNMPCWNINITNIPKNIEKNGTEMDPKHNGRLRRLTEVIENIKHQGKGDPENFLEFPNIIGGEATSLRNRSQSSGSQRIYNKFGSRINKGFHKTDRVYGVGGLESYKKGVLDKSKKRAEIMGSKRGIFETCVGNEEEAISANNSFLFGTSMDVTFRKQGGEVYESMASSDSPVKRPSNPTYSNSGGYVDKKRAEVPGADKERRENSDSFVVVPPYVGGVGGVGGMLPGGRREIKTSGNEFMSHPMEYLGNYQEREVNTHHDQRRTPQQLHQLHAKSLTNKYLAPSHYLGPPYGSGVFPNENNLSMFSSCLPQSKSQSQNTLSELDDLFQDRSHGAHLLQSDTTRHLVSQMIPLSNFGFGGGNGVSSYPMPLLRSQGLRPGEENTSLEQGARWTAGNQGRPPRNRGNPLAHYTQEEALSSLISDSDPRAIYSSHLNSRRSHSMMMEKTNSKGAKGLFNGYCTKLEVINNPDIPYFPNLANGAARDFFTRNQMFPFRSIYIYELLYRYMIYI